MNQSDIEDALEQGICSRCQRDCVGSGCGVTLSDATCVNRRCDWRPPTLAEQVRRIMALAAPTAKGGAEVPAGWKLVPIEPTKAMKEAAFGPIMEGGRGGPITADRIRQEAALSTYAKIIAASPPPPAGAAGGGSGDLGALSAGEDLADELTTLIKQLGAVWDEAIRLKEERLTKDQDNIALYWCGKRDGLRTAMMALSDYRAAVRTRLAIAQTEQHQAIRDVGAERRRQVEAEGWTPSHDDDHADGAMALAAAAYAYASCQSYRCTRSDAPSWWPWDHEFWKPSLPRRDLVKAGALILAEIERLDRAAKNAGARQKPDAGIEEIAARYAATGKKAIEDAIATQRPAGAGAPSRCIHCDAPLTAEECEFYSTGCERCMSKFHAAMVAEDLSLLPSAPTPDLGAQGEPVAWAYEYEHRGRWCPSVSPEKPTPREWLRNIRPLYEAPAAPRTGSGVSVEKAEPFSFKQPQRSRMHDVLRRLGAAAIRSQKITDHEAATAAQSECLREIEALVAQALTPPSGVETIRQDSEGATDE